MFLKKIIIIWAVIQICLTEKGDNLKCPTTKLNVEIITLPNTTKSVKITDPDFAQNVDAKIIKTECTDEKFNNQTSIANNVKFNNDSVAMIDTYVFCNHNCKENVTKFVIQQEELMKLLDVPIEGTNVKTGSPANSGNPTPSSTSSISNSSETPKPSQLITVNKKNIRIISNNANTYNNYGFIAIICIIHCLIF
ncbi:hypothetical protein K7432_017496 [Basidiobolus ranarum]|uniref:Uncharacterized protein n=1 Tax=Basidiobolus ranarum TaxID=34480 RepID=A0ABR2VKA0_9FUNG